MESGQMQTVSSTYPRQQVQPSIPDCTPHQSNSIFYESEIRKGSEIVISQSQLGAIQHGVVTTSEIKTEPDMQSQHSQQQHVFYGGAGKEVSPAPDGQQQYGSSEVTSCGAETMYAEVSQASQVGSSSQSLDFTQTETSGMLSEGMTRPVQSDKTHICLTCGKAFRNKPQLTQHELVHNGIRKHVCSYCEKAFKQICHLNQHIRVHTGERPYKCTIEGCGRAFAQLSNLNHHQKNHEEHVRRDVSRQYRCEVCDRSYANHNSLQTHIMKLHSNVRPEGEGNLMQTMSPPRAKKRKKSTAGVTSEASPAFTAVSETSDTFILNFSDAEADGLPSQVRTKSRLALTANPLLFGHTSVKDGSSASAGAPLSVSYQSSPVSSLTERYHNPPESTVAHQKMRTMVTDRVTMVTDRSTPIEEVTHLEQVASGEEVVSSAYSHRELSQIQNQQELQNFTPQSRELIQSSTPSSSDLPSLQLFHQTRLLQQTSQGVGDRSSPLVSQQLPSRSSTLVSQQSAQHLSIRSEAPSHITHHYPEQESQNKVSRPHVFNPAFSDNAGRFSQSQF